MSGSINTRVANRGIITLCVMMGNLMQSLDASIANVALPYMQGSLSASLEEVTWVLTSYVIAAAIMTAPVGWLAVRFGRKRLHMACMIGFVIASMACGAADTLTQMVCFRFLQGICGAALIPLAQATMLDIYPFERRAQAMAIFGMGVMAGPILGPTLGGYLTEMYNWRYVFYVNLPFGIIAVIGLFVFLPNTAPRSDLRFDWTGFAVLAIGVGALQLMLDRGQELDWFSSPEIVIEAVLAGLGFYLFTVHMIIARGAFLPPGLFKDRNFVCGVAMVLCTGTIMLGSSALLAPYLENLANYPVETAGLSLAPRGVGVVIGMQLASWLASTVDQRKLMAAGLLTMCTALYSVSFWTPDVPDQLIMLTLLMQGFGTGMLFNPMTVVAYTTLPASLRSYGTSLQALCRNMGQAAGVAVTQFMLVRNAQVSHADIVSTITPFDRVLQAHNAVSHWLNPMRRHGAALLNRMVNQQAQIIAYNNDFHLMAFIAVPGLLLLLLMRRHEARPATVAGARAGAGAGAGAPAAGDR